MATCGPLRVLGNVETRIDSSLLPHYTQFSRLPFYQFFCFMGTPPTQTHTSLSSSYFPMQRNSPRPSDQSTFLSSTDFTLIVPSPGRLQPGLSPLHCRVVQGSRGTRCQHMGSILNLLPNISDRYAVLHTMTRGWHLPISMCVEMPHGELAGQRKPSSISSPDQNLKADMLSLLPAPMVTSNALSCGSTESRSLAQTSGSPSNQVTDTGNPASFQNTIISQ